MGLGFAFVRFARRSDAARRRSILAIGLAVAALVYVGPAALGAGPRGLTLTLVGVVLFAGFAGFGSRHGLSWLAAGWAGHVAWDALLHLAAPTVAPSWYVCLCFGFDSVVARDALLARRDEAERATP